MLQHIGFSDKQEVYDANRISKVLWETLKNDGYWMSHECSHGDNGWEYKKWEINNVSSIKLLYKEPYNLVGSASDAHTLYLFKKQKMKQ